MRVELQPETERLVQEELRTGRFRDIDELIVQCVYVLREKRGPQAGDTAEKGRQPKSLVQFFRDSPFVGMEMKFERSQDTGRKIKL